MPKVVHNCMTITGAAEEIARFKQTCIIDGEMDFSAIMPEERNVLASSFSRTVESSDTLECYFDTAWSPPVRVWEKMGEMFPALAFELNGSCFESDLAFEGTIADGRLDLHRVPLIFSVTDPKTGETVTGTMDELEHLGLGF
jgi:hypothetical protein